MSFWGLYWLGPSEYSVIYRYVETFPFPQRHEKFRTITGVCRLSSIKKYSTLLVFTSVTHTSPSLPASLAIIVPTRSPFFEISKSQKSEHVLVRVLSETSLEPEAAPKAGLTCKATSPQANDEWCNGSCNENPDNGGCNARAFAQCEPART